MRLGTVASGSPCTTHNSLIVEGDEEEQARWDITNRCTPQHGYPNVLYIDITPLETDGFFIDIDEIAIRQGGRTWIYDYGDGGRPCGRIGIRERLLMLSTFRIGSPKCRTRRCCYLDRIRALISHSPLLCITSIGWLRGLSNHFPALYSSIGRGQGRPFPPSPLAGGTGGRRVDVTQRYMPSSFLLRSRVWTHNQ